MPIRILVADDHKIVCWGLRALLEKEPKFEVVGEAENGRIAVKLVRKLSPDVIIMDITMPDLNGIDATHQIVTKFPHIKVLVLSMHSDRKFVGEVLRSGASGYIMKDCDFEELKRAIYTVVSNQVYLSPGIAGIVIKDYVHQLSDTRLTATHLLTNREREVLQLLSEGKITKQIASSLEISIKTVETYRSKIKEKLNVHSIAEMTKYAIREGLTSLEP